MIEYNSALSYARAGDAVFILGSGFSIDAINTLGLPLLSGNSLAKELAKCVELDEDTPLDLVSQEYIDQIGEKSLSKYIKDRYEVTDYSEYYNVFAKINELKVYTTNYDNLVEFVCQNNAKKIKSYTLLRRLNNCNKKNMVMHLNGSIEEITDELPEGFNLTHLSYNNLPLYESPWYPYLIDELRSTRAIFIIGLSFKSDLDLRRLIYSEEISNKCFIIQTSKISDNDLKFLSKYGHVITCGVKKFCEDLNSVEPVFQERRISSYRFKSFSQIKLSHSYNELTDKEMYNMFFLGELKNNTFKKNEKDNFIYLINREYLFDAISLIKEGKSIIVHSDLGNGKTVFLQQIIYNLSDYKFFSLISNNNEKIIKEIELLCESKEKIIIVIDPYNLFLEELKKFKDFDLSNIQFILSARTAMHENFCDLLYEIADQMEGTDFSANPINLNTLSQNEQEELCDIITRFGFWGEDANLSKEQKVELVSRKLNSKLQSVLLYLFNEGQIKEKFVNILSEVVSDDLVMKILILSFINEILELKFDSSDFNIIFNRNNIDRVIRRRKEMLGELIDYNYNRIRVKSSIISKALIGSKIITKEILIETLLLVTNKLNQLYEGNSKYRNALINLSSASYLSFIFDYTLDSKVLIKYYEKIKENKFNKNNLFFWEQYAITCVNIKEFSRAKIYFQTSYSLAKKRGRDFSTFQIDNHYARYLLENQLYSRNHETAYSNFVEAHQLLTKIYVYEDAMNSRYYQFRVANAYKEYYDVFFKTFSEEEKEGFIKRCEEMNHKLQVYIKNNSLQEHRKYILDCKKNLKYILETYLKA